MGSPTFASTETTRTEPGEWEKYITNLVSNPKSIYSIAQKGASRRGQVYEGMAKGDPAARKAYYGFNPTAADLDAMRKGYIINPSKRLAEEAAKKAAKKAGTRTAATGGLMSLRGYAGGGKPKETPEDKFKRLTAREASGKKVNKQQSAYMKNYAATTAAGGTPGKGGKPQKDPSAVGNIGLDKEQAAFVEEMAKLMESGATPSKAQQDRLNRIEQKTGRDVSPYSDVGKITPSNPTIAGAAEQIRTGYTNAKDLEGAPQGPDYTEAQANMNTVVGFDPDFFSADPETRAKVSHEGMTNKYAREALDLVTGEKAPEEYKQASGLYSSAAKGLEGLAGYKAQDVTAQQAASQNAAAQQASAAQMGQVANVSAERAAAERAAASQMGQIGDISAQRAQTRGYDASLMNAPKDISAAEYQAAQMQQAKDVSTKDLTAYQMEGPGAWIDEGMAQKYMNPYIQGVVDISKREAGREYTKQQNALNAKARAAGAFGGARQALERSEAERNYNEQLQDIQARGLSEAYTQGRSQYSTDTAAQQAARIQNLQSQLGTQSQSSQQSLQAALSNQSMELQAAQQNMAALNQQRQTFVTQQLEAAKNNYGGQLTAEQANMVAQNAAAEFSSNAENQSAMQYATQALQAAQANQQTQFGVGSLNANLANQAALQNAQLGTQVNMGNQRAAMEAALANQQTQFGIGSLNANLANQVGLQNASLGTQAAMQNAQLGTQTSWQNAQNALNASLANQQAGLQGNQQNITAYGQMGNMATGLGSVGQYKSAWDLRHLQNMAEAANTTMGLGEKWKKEDARIAGEVLNKPSDLTKGITMPSPAGGTAGQTSKVSS